MALHPQARRALEHAADDPKVWETDIERSRELARVEAAAAPREDVEAVEDVDAGGVRCRWYRPAAAVEGVLVHLHGGGFVFHDIDVHDAAARRLANRVGLAVLSVDYRRPPEHPFPAAPDDVDTVLRWLEGEVPGPTYAHGDSAGANLALVAALRNPGRLRALAPHLPLPRPGDGGGVLPRRLRGVRPARGRVVLAAVRRRDREPDPPRPRAAPLRPLHTLPPTLVVTAEHDPLRDEGERLAADLAEQGVSSVGIRFLGQLHGFWRHPDVFDAAEPLTRTVAGFLRSHHP